LKKILLHKEKKQNGNRRDVLGLLAKASEYLKPNKKHVFNILLISLMAIITLSVTSFARIEESINYDEYQLLEHYKPEIKETINNLYGLEINERIKELEIEDVIEFYSKYTKNDDISAAIIKWALHYEVPVNTCFGLSYAESRFRPHIIGKNYVNGRVASRDYGLFQINDRYRTEWSKSDFLNIDKNAQEGIRYYSQCYYFFIDTKGQSFSFLGYNMGIGGANKLDDVPKIKNNYIDRITSLSGKLDNEFNKRFQM
jgi:hypothetical protein